MSRAILIAMVGLVLLTACRKKPAPVPVGSAQVPASPSAAPTPASAAPPDQAAVAAPLPPPSADLTLDVERRFRPKQSENAYAPAASGNYQAQLDLYNRVLRKWAMDSGNIPETMDEIMRSHGGPKPPQPPPGRILIYDRRSITARLQ